MVHSKPQRTCSTIHREQTKVQFHLMGWGQIYESSQVGLLQLGSKDKGCFQSCSRPRFCRTCPLMKHFRQCRSSPPPRCSYCCSHRQRGCHRRHRPPPLKLLETRSHNECCTCPLMKHFRQCRCSPPPRCSRCCSHRQRGCHRRRRPCRLIFGRLHRGKKCK